MHPLLPKKEGIYEKIVEPERAVIFRVPWHRTKIGKIDRANGGTCFVPLGS